MDERQAGINEMYTHELIEDAWEVYTTPQICAGGEPVAKVRAIEKISFPVFLERHYG